jgi:hypothetical protein
MKNTKSYGGYLLLSMALLTPNSSGASEELEKALGNFAQSLDMLAKLEMSEEKEKIEEKKEEIEEKEEIEIDEEWIFSEEKPK